MEYARKYRIYPNDEQIKIININFAGARKVFNHELERLIKPFIETIDNDSELREKLIILLKMKLKKQKRYLKIPEKDLTSKELRGMLSQLSNKQRKHFFKTKHNIEIESYFDINKDMVQFKKTEKGKWLYNCDARCLEYATKHVYNALNRYMNQKLRSDLSGFPRFKSRHNNVKSYTTYGDRSNKPIKIKDGKIYLPKIKEGIPIILHRDLYGKKNNATVSVNAKGQYFISFSISDGKDYPNILKDIKSINDVKIIGLDLGLKHFLVSSDGELIKNPKYLNNSLRRLSRINKRFSKKKGNNKYYLVEKACKNNKDKDRNEEARKYKKGKNFYKAKNMVSNQYNTIANKRKDFLHKLSYRIVKENDVIVVEDLGVSNMIKNKRLSKHISDSGWGEFRRQLEYKCKREGKMFIKVDRFYASSQTCYKCGYVNNKVKDLKIRKWDCPKCGTSHHRDITAAINLRNKGIEKIKELGWFNNN